MDDAGVGGPARTSLYLASQTAIYPIPDEKVVEGGIEGVAFQDDPQARFTLVVVYDSRPNFSIEIPRTRIVVRQTNTGDVLRDEFVPAPPRDEPVAIAPIVDDSVPPIVISGPSRVDNFDPTSLLTFRFSESMDAQSVKDNLVVLDSKGRRVAGEVRITELNRVATFVPFGGLKLGEEYTVELRGVVGEQPDKGGKDMIRDLSGRPLQAVRLEVRTYRPRAIATMAGAPFKDFGILRKRLVPDGPLTTSLLATTGGSSNNLSAVDVTDPFKPAVIGTESSLPSRQRIALLPDATFTFGGGDRPSRFNGDLAVTTAFNVSRSSLTFVDVTDPTRLVTLGPKVLTRVPEDYQASAVFPVVYENAYAKGIAAVQVGDEVYAYAAVERVGLMFADIGNNLPQQKLETVYPGDITDVTVYRGDTLLALDKTRGSAHIAVLGLSLEQLTSPTSLANTPQRIKVAERLRADLNADGRVLTDEVIDVAAVGTTSEILIYSLADSRGRVGDAQAPKPLSLVSRIPMKGTVRDLEIDASRLRAIAIVDEAGAPSLIVVDLARLDATSSVLDLIDNDSDGFDDRIIFRHAFPTGANGMRLDLDRGLLYIGTPIGLEIWQIFDNCCDLGIDMTALLKMRPSGRSNDVFKKELNAIRKGIVLGLDRAKEKCSGFNATMMKMIESGSSACLWTDDPEKSCGNNYQPGLSDHDFSTFMPDGWYTQMVDDPNYPDDFVGPKTQIPLAACVVSALSFPFTDPHTEEPKQVEGTEFTFHDISFLPNWIDDFNSVYYRLDRTIAGFSGDQDNDLAMGRQLQTMKHLTEAYGVDLRGVPGVNVDPSYLSLNVTEDRFEELFKQYRTVTKIPVVEGYEWSVLMDFALAKGKSYLRIAGAADEGSAFHKFHVKQLHGAGKAGIRAAVARIVSQEASRDLFLRVRRGDPPAGTPEDPQDANNLVFRKNACLVYRGDKDPLDWEATRCGSLEEYAAATAVRTLRLPANQQIFTKDEVKDIIRFYRVKGDLEPITSDLAANDFIARAVRFVKKVKRDTYPIWAAALENEATSTDPRRAKRLANREYAEGISVGPSAGPGGRIKDVLEDAKFPLTPHLFNRSFRNAPRLKLRMYHAKPGQQNASPDCGDPKYPLTDCAFTVDLAGGEHVYASWRRKSDGSLLLDDESVLAVGIYKIKLDFIADEGKSGHVAFTIDLPEKSVNEANRENNLGGFYYYLLGLDGALPAGLVFPEQVPSPLPASAFDPDAECVDAPALKVTQRMTLDDDLKTPKTRLPGPALLYLGQQATLEIDVSNTSPNSVKDTRVCTTLTNKCYDVGSIGPNATRTVPVAFSSLKPVVVESVASAISPDVGIATSSPYSVAVNCEPLIVFYEPDPNTMGSEFSVMAGGRAVRYARALNPFTGEPALNTKVKLSVTPAVASAQTFFALRPHGGLGTPDPTGDLTKDIEGMGFKVPGSTPFAQYQVRIDTVNEQPQSCGVPINFDFKVRAFEYTQSLGVGMGAKFGLKVEFGATGGIEGGLKFTFNVKRDHQAPEGADPIAQAQNDLGNIVGLDYEPSSKGTLTLKAGTSLFEVGGEVSGLIKAKADAKAEATAGFSLGLANRFHFGGYNTLTGPSGASEREELGALILFTLFEKGAYQIDRLAQWIPALRRPFERVLKQVARFEPRRTHSVGTFGVALHGEAHLFKGDFDILPPPKPAEGAEPPKESGKTFLNLTATYGGNADIETVLEQVEGLKVGERTQWVHLDFKYEWKTAFEASLPAWQADLENSKFSEDEDVDAKIKERGKEELGNLEKLITNGLEKVCAPDCGTDQAGGVSFGVFSKLEAQPGGLAPQWVYKKVLVRFRSPKELATGTEQKDEKGEYALTFTVDADRFAPGSEEFKKMLGRLLGKLKGVAQALTDKQRERANLLIQSVQEGNLQQIIVDANTPEPFDGEKVFKDFMGALRAIIDTGDASEEITKRKDHEFKIGGKISVFGAGAEIEFTPLKFQRTVEYTKAKGRLLAGKLFMLEDYTDTILNPFDPKAYFTETVDPYMKREINQVLEQLRATVVEHLEEGKKVIEAPFVKLKQAVLDSTVVKMITWPFLKNQLPQGSPAPYRPLDDLTVAGRPHYGINGFHMFDSETGVLSEPGTIELTYVDADIEGTVEANLRAFRWNAERQDWDLVAATHDTTANTFTVTTPLLGLYTVGAIMPRGDITWTVTNATVTGSGASATTTVTLESDVVRNNDGSMVLSGSFIHIRPVADQDLGDFGADPIGEVLTPDAALALDGAQVAVSPDGRIRVQFRVPGTQSAVSLHAYSEHGTLDGSGVVELPPLP